MCLPRAPRIYASTTISNLSILLIIVLWILGSYVEAHLSNFESTYIIMLINYQLVLTNQQYITPIHNKNPKHNQEPLNIQNKHHLYLIIQIKPTPKSIKDLASHNYMGNQNLYKKEHDFNKIKEQKNPDGCFGLQILLQLCSSCPIFNSLSSLFFSKYFSL